MNLTLEAVKKYFKFSFAKQELKRKDRNIQVLQMNSNDQVYEIGYQSVSQMVESGIMSSRELPALSQSETSIEARSEMTTISSQSDIDSELSDDENFVMNHMIHYGSDGEIFFGIDLNDGAEMNDSSQADVFEASTAAHDDPSAVAVNENEAVVQNLGVDFVDDPFVEWHFIDQEELLNDVHTYDHHALDEAERTNLFLSHGIIKRPSGSILHPNHPEYKLESSRLASFKLWPGGLLSENKIIILLILLV